MSQGNAREVATNRPTTGYWLRENVRQLVGALVLVLFVRHFVVEIFKIPTGSMAETLYGTHIRVDCPRCGWSYVVGAPQGEVTEDLRSREAPCNHCGLENRLGDFPDHGGHKIIANKWIYRVRDPKRWEVVVFRFYDERHRPVNYIKRLVGLPGERVEIKGGDVYVDGAIAAKPSEVQEAVWIPVYDGRFENPWKPGWFMEPGWSYAEGAWRLAGAAAPARLTLAHPIANALVYNNADVDAARPVGDLRLSAAVEAAPGGRVTFILREGEDAYHFTLAAAGPGEAVHWRGGRDVRRWPLAAPLPAGRAARVSAANWDDTLRLSVDGRVILQESVPGDVAPVREESGVTIEGEGALVLRDVRIDRDIFYTPGTRAVFDVPEGEYFFLGDNSANSNDSRSWNDPAVEQVHTVKRDRLLGRAAYALLYVELDWPWEIPWRRISVKGVR